MNYMYLGYIVTDVSKFINTTRSKAAVLIPPRWFSFCLYTASRLLSTNSKAKLLVLPNANLQINTKVCHNLRHNLKHNLHHRV